MLPGGHMDNSEIRAREPLQVSFFASFEPGNQAPVNLMKMAVIWLTK
jgi:hypothetical protein